MRRSDLFKLLLLGGAVALFYGLERRRPLRRVTEPKPTRNLRNLAVAGLTAAAVLVVEQPVLRAVAAAAERRRWGLLRRLQLPAWLETVAAVVLMDYTLYLWHILIHRVPLLWRFHRVHHVDLDMDASTALRLHFGDILVVLPFEVARVVALGVSPRAQEVWHTLTVAEVLFHHSNVELPPRVERLLNRFVVTPRMHGTHHSVVRGEQHSNWSSGLVLWDWLHGTLRRDVPPGDVTVGVPAYRDPDEVTLPDLVAMPFGEQRPTWEPPAIRGR